MFSASTPSPASQRKISITLLNRFLGCVPATEFLASGFTRSSFGRHSLLAEDSAAEAGFANWSKKVLKGPICDTETLSSGNTVRATVVDTDVDARVDDLVLSLREASERACLLHGVRVSRGDLKIQLVGTEEKSQRMRNSAADGGMTRRVLGEIGRVDEWLPIRIDFSRWIVVLVGQPDSSDRSPKIVKVFALPAGDLSVGKCGIRQGEHAGRIAQVAQIVARDVAQGVLPQQRTTIGPKVPQVSLLRRASSACERTNCLYLVVFRRPFFAG